MQRLLALLGTTIGGWAGWSLGVPLGLMTAFLLSVVGTGVGLYVARRLAQHLLP
jgi:hypothetical protein